MKKFIVSSVLFLCLCTMSVRGLATNDIIIPGEVCNDASKISCTQSTNVQQIMEEENDCVALSDRWNLDGNADQSRFEVGKGTFLLHGKPFIVKAAELHYPRIPRSYWDQRIKLCKALGMNTVCLYVFWNIHEPQPGVFDFTDGNDLAEFCRLS